jgi:hypothetical protein
MEDTNMQVIQGVGRVSRGDRLAVAGSAAVSLLLILAGAALAWVFLTTPLLGTLMPEGRLSGLQTLVSVAAWGIAIVVPAGLVMLGLTQLVSTVTAALSHRPRRVTPSLARALGPDHLAATDLVLPDGRRIHELVLGPFGILVLGDVPPPSASRHVGNRWAVRGPHGQWIPIEEPADRASRDAERVRAWLSADEQDFLVRVYAAVVTDDPQIERTASCAVVAPGGIAAWLDALPPQRTLTPERRAHLVDLVRSAMPHR